MTASKKRPRRSKSTGAATKRSPKPINLGPLADWVGFRLRMAQEASFEAFSRRSREIGESPGRFATLILIAQNPGISQSTLGRASGRDKSSMTPVLEDLVRRGLVERRRTEADRRAYRLTLTDTGIKVLAQLTACARGHEQMLDRLIGPRERSRFMRVLRRIAKVT